MAADDDFDDKTITHRMNAAVLRALNTPPIPTKELIGKTERAMAQRESRIRKELRSKPKSP
jgi:hypothetical protein